MTTTFAETSHHSGGLEDLLHDLGVLSPPEYLQQHGKLASFASGERIFHEGGVATTLFLIRHGRVVLERHPPSGPLQVETVGPGEVLGWSWLIPPYRWHFDARALEPTEALVVDGMALRQLCESDHEIGYRVLKQFSSLIVRRLERFRHSADSAAGVVLPGAGEVSAMLGTSQGISEARVLLAKAASTNCPVLLRAESACGVAQVARAIHMAGAHRMGPFNIVDCADMPASAQESELFGTPSLLDDELSHPGILAASVGGTLFLDEVARLSPTVQARLLHFLDETEGPAVESAERPRLVTATSESLEGCVEAEIFSPQLLLRLGVITIRLPALRHRAEDTRLLADHFLVRYYERCGQPVTSLSEAAASELMSYRWPGNLRELRDVIEGAARRAVDDTAVEPAHLPDHVRAASRVLTPQEGESLTHAMQRIKRQFVQETLVDCAGNRTHAAQRLGLSRTNLQKTMKRLGIH